MSVDISGTPSVELVGDLDQRLRSPYAESVACLVFWRLTEEALDAERSNGEAVERSHAELTQANRAVSDLVAMLSHDCAYR